MKHAYFLFAVLPIMAGCATAIDGSSQKVSFQAVGASEVMCEVNSGELKYVVRPPQTITLKKSRRDLDVTCQAGGNRVKHMTVESSLSGWVLTNVGTGIIPGAAWDAESGAMFEYPDIIIVDFSGTKPSYEPLPSYHAADGLDSKESSSSIESFGPSVAKISSDDERELRHKLAQQQRDREDSIEAERAERKYRVEGGWEGDKGGKSVSPPQAPVPSNTLTPVAPF